MVFARVMGAFLASPGGSFPRLLSICDMCASHGVCDYEVVYVWQMRMCVVMKVCVVNENVCGK